jgi:hypothetical protein
MKCQTEMPNGIAKPNCQTKLPNRMTKLNCWTKLSNWMVCQIDLAFRFGKPFCRT